MKKEVLEAFDGKTVLVTGGAGAIGSNLVKALIPLETRKIIILDNLSSSCKWNIPVDPKVSFIKGSVLDDEKLKKASKNMCENYVGVQRRCTFTNPSRCPSPQSPLAS